MGADSLNDLVHDDEEVCTMAETRARYALSFTSGALLAREALIAAPIYLGERDWIKTRKLLEQDNLLQARTGSSEIGRAHV